MEKSMVRLPDRLKEAAEGLAENLLAAEPFVLYDRANIRLNADTQSRNLLEQLSTVQAKIRSGQTNGGVTRQDIDQLRALQSEVQQNQAIMDYARAQQNAINYLREINQEISQLLGMDFATLARQTSC
jgi:cell fate (sporulation/competence/biofilm development) regulator YlbF (YheA/YmcA/DUF963 family)